jgi:hypothetical protein
MEVRAVTIRISPKELAELFNDFTDSDALTVKSIGQQGRNSDFEVELEVMDKDEGET